MNNIKKFFISLSLLLICFNNAAFACPCGTGYKYYYLIVGSGPDREKVLEAGNKISQRLGHKFSFEGSSLYQRKKNCGEKLDNCLVLVSSDDEVIGKGEPSTVEGISERRTYAASYIFQSYDSKKNKAAAQTLLKKVRVSVKDAYIKSIDACACE